MRRTSFRIALLPTLPRYDRFKRERSRLQFVQRCSKNLRHFAMVVRNHLRQLPDFLSTQNDR